MIINLLCKAFIAILDILLLDFYLKNIYPDVYKRKFKNIKYFVYLVICISLLFINDIISYLFIHLNNIIFLLIIYYSFRINKVDFIKKIFSYYLTKNILPKLFMKANL